MSELPIGDGQPTVRQTTESLLEELNRPRRQVGNTVLLAKAIFLHGQIIEAASERIADAIDPDRHKRQQEQQK